MKEKKDTILPAGRQQSKEKKVTPAGYTTYPASDDIYNKAKNEVNTDPEDITKLKSSNEMEDTETGNEKDFANDVSGSDLDVPGSDLDDKEEAIGSEDEENNLYSTGGDNHYELEENKGE